MIPYAETTAGAVESRGRLFVDGRRFTATDYLVLRRGLDKAVAYLEEVADAGDEGASLVLLDLEVMGVVG